ncbi:MAG: GNAT family N-acetyltransferase [Bacteroidetes bacterium]|nr:GNAT family N-acetyltransferase [Bacteroidota bacterium]
MKIFAETERLLLREILPSDDEGMFALDSDAAVHRYLGNKPVKSIEESRQLIAFIRQQYIDNGIGRWAVIEKATGDFIGWSGLKLVTEPTNGHTHFYDVGYRLIRQYWGKGFATESARVALQYGFETLEQDMLYGMADVENLASGNVLEKIGMKRGETFLVQGIPHYWFSISRDAWRKC